MIEESHYGFGLIVLYSDLNRCAAVIKAQAEAKNRFMKAFRCRLFIKMESLIFQGKCT